MRCRLHFNFLGLSFFLLCFCANEKPPALSTMKKVLFPPADSASQAQIYAQFHHYLSFAPDSVDIFIKNNQIKIYRFYSRLMRQAAIARLENDRQTARAYLNLGAIIALKSRIYFNDLHYPYIYQYYASLSDQQLHKKILSDYYNYLGFLENSAQRNDRAEFYFRKTIRLAQEVGDLVGESYAQYTLYSIYNTKERAHERQIALQRAHELIAKSYHKTYEIRLLNSESEENYNIGYYEHAAFLINRSCQLGIETGDSSDLAVNYERLGVCYMRMGHFSLATKFWQQAEKIARTKSDTLLLTNLLTHQGILCVETSQFQEAIPYYRKAGQLYLTLNDSLSYSITRVNSGIPFFQLGQYDSALVCLDEGLGIQERHKFYDNAVLTLTTISNIYNKLNNLEAAQRYFRRAEKYLPQVSGLLSKATLYRIIGEFYLLTQKPDSAYSLYQKAKIVSQEMGDSLYLAFAHDGLGQAALKKNDLDLARSHFDQMHDIARKKNNGKLLFYAYYNFARLNIALQQNQLALEYFQKAIDHVERIRESVAAMDYKMSYFAHQLQIYSDLINFAIEQLQSPERAFVYTEKANARILFELLQMKSLKNSAMTGSPKVSGMALKNGDFSPFATSIVNPKSGYRFVQKNLPPKTCLIEYYLTKTYAFVWLIDSLNVSSLVLKIPYDSLRHVVDAFRKDIGADLIANFQERVRQNPQATFSSNLTLSNQLYDMLIEPFASHLKDYKTLVIIPHDFLTYLPFAALSNNGTVGKPNFLVESYSLITAPSSTIFALSYQKSQKSPAINPMSRLLSISAPISDIQYLRKLSDDLKRLFHQPNVIDDPVEEGALYRQMQSKVDIIHFSSHCIIYENNPLSSHLLLREHQPQQNPEKAETGSPANDGLLTAKEILYQDLSHVDLVTLASCETALGKYYGGEGLVGLTFAFLGSGAHNIVSALWKVDDRFTYEIMHSFYRNINQPTLSSATSLQLACLTVIQKLQKDPQIKYPFPYYWAAFSCCGYCR